MALDMAAFRKKELPLWQQFWDDLITHNDNMFDANGVLAKSNAGPNAPGITYTVGGKQYVAVVAGGNSILGALGLTKAQAAKNHGDSVYVFAMP